MAQTKYQRSPDSGNYQPRFGPNPQTTIVQSGQGTVAKPVPPKAPGPWRAKLPAPSSVKAPGASGTI